MEIATNTLSEAHEAACDVIINQHREIDIQTHKDKSEFTLEFMPAASEDEAMVLRVLHPFWEPQVSRGTRFGPLFSREYRKQFLTITPHREDGNHATYTYYNRSADFPFSVYNPQTGNTLWAGDGDGRGFNQIAALVEKLAADPNSRRGVIVTWNPLLDARSTEPPCMDMIQVIIRGQRVHMRVVFRSQDMLLGLPENLVGEAALMGEITRLLQEETLLGYEPGVLTHVSLTPHIYKKRDGQDFDLLRAEIHRKKTLGQWHPIITGANI